MRRLGSIPEFQAAVRDGSRLLITDSANGDKVHVATCSHVKQRYFEQKVIEGGEKNGSYFVLETASEGEGIRRCPVCLG